jgi:hypothetical protein
MADSFLLTQRTPPRGFTDSDNSTIHLTPIINFDNIEKENSEMDVIDTFLTHRNSKSCIAPRKRKHSGLQSEAEIQTLKERMVTLEKTVEDLATLIKEKDRLNKEEMTAPTKLTTETESGDQEDELNDLLNITKNNRDNFYLMYGELKAKRSHFTNEQLSQKLADGEFILFKELRAKLTAWVKTGLGLSRQLEQFIAPTYNPDNIPPLLTIRSLAISLNNDFELYLHEIDQLRRNLLIKVVTEANTKLAILNIETRTMIEQLGDTEAAVIIAKAFKAATQAGSYLYKQRNAQTTTQEIGPRGGHESSTYTLPIQQQRTQINQEMQQQRPFTKPLYSQVVATDSNTSAAARDKPTYRGATGNWRLDRDPSNSPNYRHTNRFEPKTQRERNNKPYNNHTRTDNRSAFFPSASSQGIPPPRPGPTQDQTNMLMQPASTVLTTHPHEPNLPGPTNTSATREQTIVQKEPQGRRESETTYTQNYTNTDIGRDYSTRRN